MVKSLRYIIAPLLLTVAGNAFAADASQIKAIRDYVVRHGTVRDDVDPVARYHEVVFNGRQINYRDITDTLTSPKESSELTVTVGIKPDGEERFLVSLRDFYYYSDSHRIRWFQDGSTKPNSIDGTIDVAIEAVEEFPESPTKNRIVAERVIDLKDEKNRKKYQLFFDLIINPLSKYVKKIEN
ncbi:hypothetical protein HYX05_03175 [Candidatus Woesearchaeota archaeon]|nr:hypothetical protein [Candidatus Woesearchaeota archaeon]